MNVGFSHFHEIVILSMMNILAPYQICIYCETMWFLQLEYNSNLLLFFILLSNHDFGR